MGSFRVRLLVNQSDLHIDIVATTMSKNNFQTIKRNLHLADNHNLTHEDKAVKVNPLNNLFNIALKRLDIFYKNFVL